MIIIHDFKWGLEMRLNYFTKLLVILLILTLSNVFAYENGIEVRTEAPGVKVYLDGKYIDVTKEIFGMNILRIENIEPGYHELKCQLKGFETYKSSITVKETEVATHLVKFVQTEIKTRSLDASSGEQVKSTGTIIVKSKPSRAQVSLDAVAMGVSDIVFEQVPVGDRKIEVYFDKTKSDQKLSISLDVGKNDTITVIADFYSHSISQSVTNRSMRIPSHTDFVIHGIIWDRSSPYTAINDSIYGEGDSLGKYIVFQIEDTCVTLKSGSEYTKLFIDRK